MHQCLFSGEIERDEETWRQYHSLMTSTSEPTPVNKHDAQSKTDQLNQQNDHLAKVGIQEEFSIEDVSMSNFTTMKSSLL